MKTQVAKWEEGVLLRKELLIKLILLSCGLKPVARVLLGCPSLLKKIKVRIQYWWFSGRHALRTASTAERVASSVTACSFVSWLEIVKM